MTVPMRRNSETEGDGPTWQVLLWRIKVWFWQPVTGKRLLILLGIIAFAILVVLFVAPNQNGTLNSRGGDARGTKRPN
jgi:hypothetical protein